VTWPATLGSSEVDRLAGKRIHAGGRLKNEASESGDEALLREIRDRYKYALETWEEIRKERRA